jgi:tetratricopeptide (TPR) repeat protein
MDRGFRNRYSRVLAGVLFLGAAVSLWQIGAPAHVAAAQSDLRFISVSTWTADPAARRVHVQAVVTATSHTVDGNGRRYYYDQIQLTLPPFSAGFGATSATGQKLPITVDATTSSGVVLAVGLGQRLYSGQTGSFTLKFDLVDSGSSPDRDFRINDNVVSFPVWAFGSPNTRGSSVTVSFPSGFTVQQEFGGLTQGTSAAGKVVFSSGVIPDSTELSAWFTAVKPVPPGDIRTRPLVIGPLKVDLKYWVGDVGWADQVERVLRLGYPALRDMIGLGDPANKAFTVEEASTQEIGSFSGAYNSRNGHVQVSYFADAFVILHEVAHMWFNSDLLSDRWAQEGFASYYAQQVVDRLGYTDHAPVLTDRMRQNAVPLNDWVTASQPDLPVNGYLYGASLKVAQQISSVAGQDGLVLVWSALRSDKAGYQPIHGDRSEPGGGATDWRRLLDLLEQRTGHSYASIWRDWVVDPSQSALLQQREAALTVYSEALKAAASWDLPQEIRRSLDAWQFGQAIAFIGQARGILAQRDQIAAQSGSEQTTPPLILRTDFEHSSLGVAADEATSELAALNELSAARQARIDAGGAVRAVGLLGADPEADLDSARLAFARGDLSRAVTLAANARAAWQNSNGAARVRILGSLLLLAGGLLLFVVILWTRGGGRRRRGIRAGPTVEGEATPDGGTPSAGAKTKGPRRKTLVAAIPADTSAADGADPSGSDRLGVGDRPEGNGDSPVAADDVPTSSDESAYDLLQRGHSLLRERHNAQAAVVLERAARLERSKGSILEALGRAYFNSGQHARAAETFEALLEIDPSAHYGHFALGLSFARLGRAPEARTHLRLAAALDPGSDTYRRALEKMEVGMG